MKENNVEKYPKESNIKFNACILTFIIITAIDLIKNNLSSQLLIIALLYFFIGSIEKFKKTAKKVNIVVSAVYFLLLAYMIYDYVVSFLNS